MNPRNIRKLVLIALLFTIPILSFAWFYLSAGFNPAPELSGKKHEIERLASPDSMVDAILYQGGGGAASGVIYEIYIVPHGGVPKDHKEALFIADNQDSLGLLWSKPKRLEIRYATAHISHFANFWESKEKQQFRYVVELKLKPLNDEWSLGKDDRGE